MPGDVADDGRLGKLHWRFLAHVGRQNAKRGYIRISQTEQAAKWGCSRQKLNEAINELVDWGYIEKLSQEDARESWCSYRTVIDREGEGVSPVGDTPPPHRKGVSPVGDGSVTSGGQGCHPGGNTHHTDPLVIDSGTDHPDQKTDQTDPHSAAERLSAGVCDLESDSEKRDTKPKSSKARRKPTTEQFDRFWEAYPRRKDREDAKRVFMRMSPEDAERALAAAAKFAAEFTRSGKKLDYCKYPATWLDKRSFEDYAGAEESQEGGLKPLWWVKSFANLPRYQPDFWPLITKKYANGVWDARFLCFPPGHPKCPIPQKVIDEMGLMALYGPDQSHKWTRISDAERALDRAEYEAELDALQGELTRRHPSR